MACVFYVGVIDFFDRLKISSDSEVFYIQYTIVFFIYV